MRQLPAQILDHLQNWFRGARSGAVIAQVAKAFEDDLELEGIAIANTRRSLRAELNKDIDNACDWFADWQLRHLVKEANVADSFADFGPDFGITDLEVSLVTEAEPHRIKIIGQQTPIDETTLGALNARLGLYVAKYHRATTAAEDRLQSYCKRHEHSLCSLRRQAGSPKPGLAGLGSRITHARATRALDRLKIAECKARADIASMRAADPYATCLGVLQKSAATTLSRFNETVIEPIQTESNRKKDPSWIADDLERGIDFAQIAQVERDLVYLNTLRARGLVALSLSESGKLTARWRPIASEFAAIVAISRRA